MSYDWNAVRRERYQTDPVFRAKEQARKARQKKARYENDPEYRERSKQRSLSNYRKNVEGRKARYRRYGKEQTAKKYGMTREEYEAFLEQPCAICGSPAEVVDHCHSHGHVRGALCRACNVSLGLMKDNPDILRSAAAYLER